MPVHSCAHERQRSAPGGSSIPGGSGAAVLCAHKEKIINPQRLFFNFQLKYAHWRVSSSQIMSIIIKLQGLPLEANSVDVRLYFLGLTIPDGGVHIVGGDEGTVFIEFASDEDARQAMARGVGVIKNSNIKLFLSSRTEMQSVIDLTRQKNQQMIAQQQQLQQQQHLQQLQQTQAQPIQPLLPHITTTAVPTTTLLPQTTQQPFQQPTLLLQPQQQQSFQQQPSMLLPTTQQQPQQPQQPQMQPWSSVPQMQVPLLPWIQQPNPQTTVANQQPTSLLHPQTQILRQQTDLLQQQQMQQFQQQQQQNNNLNNRARMSGMRGGDDKLFADKRCVLAATNIPYRATSKDIMEFLSDFNIKEDCIRRRYNQKGQPTADAKIAFPTPDAAMKAIKMMNKKNLCGRPVFLKPV